MIHSRGPLGGALLLAAVLAAPQAHADKATAKRLTEQATLAYKLGHFQEALEDFSMAYGEFSAPLLLFNIGQCYREIGNYERAVFFLQGYLREIPRARNRALVEDLIAECETKLAAQQAELKRRQEEDREQRALKLAEALAEQQAAHQNRVEAPAIDRLGLQRQERAGKTKLATGLGIAAAGVVAIGVGAYFSVRANSDASTIDGITARGEQWGPSAQSTYRDGSHAVVAADVLYIAGAAVVIAGGVVAVLGWQQGTSAKKTLSVVGLAPSVDGHMALNWSF